MKKKRHRMTPLRRAFPRAARGSLLVAVLALSLLGAVSCAEAGVSSGVLIFGRNKDALTLDPATAFDGLSLVVTRNLYDGLTRYRPGTFDVEPALATSWTVSPDGRMWRFKLRRGVRFQDGTPFDAAAVAFNFDRWRLPGDPYHAGGNFVYWESMFGGFPGKVSAVKAVGSDVVEIRLAQPLAPLLADLAMPAFGIASPTAIKREGADYFREPVGTGPYRLKEWVKDDHITLERFDGYWSTKASIKTVILKDIPDAGGSLLALQSGEIDAWEFPTPDALRILGSDSRFIVYHEPANAAMWLRINVTHRPLDDVRVRRAIAMAIDRRAIVREFFDPSATVADELLPAAVWPHGVVVALPHDVAAARAELRAAGFPHGFATTLWFPTAPRPYMPEPGRIAEAVQSDLRAIGIDARLQGMEWGVWLARIENGEHDLTVGGWGGDNGDPDNFLYATFDEDAAHAPGASNSSFWRDDAFHALVLAGQRASDPAVRAEAYRRALGIIRDQQPAVPIAHTSAPIVFRGDIAGFVPPPDGMIEFAELRRSP